MKGLAFPVNEWHNPIDTKFVYNKYEFSCHQWHAYGNTNVQMVRLFNSKVVRRPKI